MTTSNYLSVYVWILLCAWDCFVLDSWLYEAGRLKTGLNRRGNSARSEKEDLDNAKLVFRLFL